MSRFITISLRRLHYHRLTALSPSTGRSFCTAGQSSEEDHTPNNSGVAGNVGTRRKSSEIKLVNDSYFVMRFDVPGVTASNLKLWVDEKKDIRFEGSYESDPKYENPAGAYVAKIPGSPSICEMEQMKAELKHGVLWITLPLKEEAKNVIKMKHDFAKKGMV